MPAAHKIISDKLSKTAFRMWPEGGFFEKKINLF